MTKLNDDALQIVEQILPYFQPAYNLTIELVESIKEKRDVPIVLENVTMQDDYEGDFSSRRGHLHSKIYCKDYLLVQYLLLPKILSKSPLSTIVPESIQQIRKEKYLTLPYQEQLKTMLVMQQQHLQMILIRQLKLLRL